jgi:hypothetical protein
VPGQAAQSRFLEAAAAELGLPVTPLPASATPVAPAPAPRPHTPAALPATAAIDGAALERIARELAAFLGPVARVLVQRSAPSAPTEAALYAALAAHVPEGRERQVFLAGAPPG